MIAFVEKIKQRYEIWKIEKYTRRRTLLPEYESRDKDYYATHYEDGVYYAEAPVRNNSSNTIVAGGEKTIKALQRAPSVATKRAGSLMRSQSKRSYLPPPRCSETYNASLQR